jgi:hypothetical protein
MLQITIPGIELYDEETQTFSTFDDIVLNLEHSLVSVSKWESKFEKPFLADNDKSNEEIFEYIKFMIINDNYSNDALERLTPSNISQINEYINSKQSATSFGSMPDKKVRGETITSELVYYWMVAFNIPFECQYWHLNRLFSLVRICNIKNGKPQKLSRSELAQRNKDLNEQRRKELGTSG